MCDDAAAGEQERFDKLAQRWWDPHGPMRPLHAMNPLRADWIRDRVREAGFGVASDPASRPSRGRRAGLDGLAILDIGCAGGLLSEALTRAGARVTGVDVAGEAVEAARQHAKRSGLAIDYRVGTLRQAVPDTPAFDVVCALEVLEHVDDPPGFLSACAARLRPGGLFVLSTIARTPESLLLAKVAAEYVVRVLPAGTHRWGSFRNPDEVEGWLRPLGLQRMTLTGMGYLPGLNVAWWRDNTRVNWMGAWRKAGACG